MKDWEFVPLGEISRPKQWPTLSKKDLLSEGFPVYGANGPIGFTNSYTHERPTILIGCRGSCGSLHLAPPRAYANGNAMALDELDETRALPEFLIHYFRSRGFRDVTTGTSQPQIIGQNLVRVRVPLPPLPEQRRIAAILDKAEALRTKRREALARLDTLAQSIFSEMFGDPVNNPHGLPVRPLKELIDPNRPITYGILMPGPDVQEGVPYVRVVDMKDGGIDLTGIRRTTYVISDSYKRSLLQEGDLLMSIRGHVGRFAVVPPELEGANITQDTARFALCGIEPFYLRECLRSPGFQNWMARRTKGAAVQGINLGDVKTMPIPVPPLQDQVRFAEMVTSTDRFRGVQGDALVQSEALCFSLQHRIFRGE